MDQIYEAVRWAEGIAVSSPVFFASMPAQAKAMVDRFQCAWVAKYRLGVPWVDASAGRRLALLTVGAMTISRFHEQIKDVVRAWAAVVNFRMRGEAAFLGVDEAGAIRTLAGVEGKVLATARDFLECR
jgi:NAD(P)H-dependent FMN reductase